MKKIFLSLALVLGIVMSNGVVVQASTYELVNQEVSPRWWGTGTTGWLQDALGYGQVQLEFEYQDSPHPQILRVNKVAAVRSINTGVEIYSARIHSYSISANGRSARVSIIYTMWVPDQGVGDSGIVGVQFSV